MTAGIFEAYRKWFNYPWGIAGPLRPAIAASMPRLVLPEGDMEAALLWDAFRNRRLDKGTPEQAPIRVEVDPESGEVVLSDENGEPVASPTDKIGVPNLDHLAEGVASVFDVGALVSIDKLGRIPPLEAPVKPEWLASTRSGTPDLGVEPEVREAAFRCPFDPNSEGRRAEALVHLVCRLKVKSKQPLDGCLDLMGKPDLYRSRRLLEIRLT